MECLNTDNASEVTRRLLAPLRCSSSPTTAIRMVRCISVDPLRACVQWNAGIIKQKGGPLSRFLSVFLA